MKWSHECWMTVSRHRQSARHDLQPAARQHVPRAGSSTDNDQAATRICQTRQVLGYFEIGGGANRFLEFEALRLLTPNKRIKIPRSVSPKFLPPHSAYLKPSCPATTRSYVKQPCCYALNATAQPSISRRFCRSNSCLLSTPSSQSALSFRNSSATLTRDALLVSDAGRLLFQSSI